MHSDLQYFRFSHLPPALQATSKPFADLAHFIARELPENEQSRRALEHLLIAKDAAVRSTLDPLPPSSRQPPSSPGAQGDPAPAHGFR
jgi:hypothetical protein